MLLRSLRVARILVPTAALGASLWLWERMPDPMPIHWGLDGRADGWAPRAIGLVLLPLVALGLTGAISLFTRRSLSEKNQLRMEITLASTAGFLALVHGLALDAALSTDHVLALGAVAGAMGALTIALGLAMRGIEPNRWMGIRTASTLRDATIWTLVHDLAARTFAVAGALAIAAAFLAPPSAALVVAIGSLIAAALVPTVYAYALGRARPR